MEQLFLSACSIVQMTRKVPMYCIGGALVIQLNVDRGGVDYFDGGKDYVTYGSVSVQAIAFQNDILRLC